jgi:hypothetical protein
LQTSLPKGKGEDGEMCSDEDDSDDDDEAVSFLFILAANASKDNGKGSLDNGYLDNFDNGFSNKY